MIVTNSRNTNRNGFTLLELLVVVAILAIVAGGLVVAYEGLEGKASRGVASFNISALDSAIRNYHQVQSSYPDEWDSLLFSEAGDGRDGDALNILSSELKEKLGAHTLTAGEAKALNAKGIVTARYVSGVMGYDNGSYPSETVADVPNRIFDNRPRGYGRPCFLSAGMKVAAVKGIGQPDFSGNTPSDSSLLRHITRLDETKRHVVVAFGIGNNLSMVKNQDAVGAGISEAPACANVQKHEYGRYIALFHLSTTKNDDNFSDIFDSGDSGGKARFLGVIDTRGVGLDEQLSEFSGQKP